MGWIQQFNFLPCKVIQEFRLRLTLTRLKLSRRAECLNSAARSSSLVADPGTKLPPRICGIAACERQLNLECLVPNESQNIQQISNVIMTYKYGTTAQ